MRLYLPGMPDNELTLEYPASKEKPMPETCIPDYKDLLIFPVTLHKHS